MSLPSSKSAAGPGLARPQESSSSVELSVLSVPHSGAGRGRLIPAWKFFLAPEREVLHEKKMKGSCASKFSLLFGATNLSSVHICSGAGVPPGFLRCCLQCWEGAQSPAEIRGQLGQRTQGQLRPFLVCFQPCTSQGGGTFLTQGSRTSQRDVCLECVLAFLLCLPHFPICRMEMIISALWTRI